MAVEEDVFTYRTIVMNTQNYGVTEYTDLQLSGMVYAFGKRIAINQNNLIHWGAALDNQLPIQASLQTGVLDFSDKFYFRPRDIWVTLKSGKKILLTIQGDELASKTYISENFDSVLRKTRVKVGRGFYSAFYDFIIENIEGEFIEIENIHVLSEAIGDRKR